jgi:hypothetical protein
MEPEFALRRAFRRSPGKPLRRLSSAVDWLRAKLAETVRDLLFWAMFYVYLWHWVDLRLIAHGAGIITNFPAFFTGWEYIREFVPYPGGAVEYLGALVSQFFYIAWAGAAVATFQAWLAGAATAAILGHFGLSRLRCLRFLPGLLLLATYTQYSFHFACATALTFSLLSTSLYLRLASAQPRVTSGTARRLVLFGVVSVVLYTLAGGAYLVFAAVVVLHEISRRQWWPGAACLVIGGLLPYAEGVAILSESTANAYGALLPYPWEKLALQGADEGLLSMYVLYLFLPATLLSGALWPMTGGSLAGGRTTAWVRGTLARIGRPAARRGRAGFTSTALRWAVASLALFVIAGAIAVMSHNPQRRTLFKVDYYAYQQEWPRVLQVARRHPHNIVVTHAANLALYHTGRLGYDMFRYPQQPATLMLTGLQYVHEYWKKFDMYIELGYLNLSENGLNECIERFGEQPLILKRLALINMVKGRVESARIYLRALAKTVFHATWARQYLARLTEDPTLATDTDIQRLRSMMIRKDHLAKLATDGLLLDALDASPENRMAFEYLMAYRMLTRRLDRFAEDYARIEHFEYREAPPLYQEALLLHAAQTRRPVNLHGHSASPGLYERFRAMNEVIRGHGGRPADAFDALADDYGDTFFFYYLYQVTGSQGK